MLDMIREAGTYGWLVLLTGVVAVGLAVAYVVVAESVVRWLTIGALATVALAAGAGWTSGRAATDSAVSSVDPAMAEALRRQGYAESDRCWQLALPFIVLGGIVFAVGEMKRQRSVKPPV